MNMKNLKPKKSVPAIWALLQLAVLKTVSGQNCGCAPDLCCSQFGYCGTSADYCGPGCLSGPCTTSRFMCYTPLRIRVADIVTNDFFNGIANQSASSCPGRDFYLRSAFLRAVRSFPEFGTTGSSDDAKREIAAFFAHVTHMTGCSDGARNLDMCDIEGGGSSGSVCDTTNMEWPCTPNKTYHGRGPLQLAWNYNYGPAGQNIGFDGLNNPEIVAMNPVISFKASLWFWMKYCHEAIASRQDFVGTVMALYGGSECNPTNARKNVRYYRDYCKQLGVDPGTKLQC